MAICRLHHRLRLAVIIVTRHLHLQLPRSKTLLVFSKCQAASLPPLCLLLSSSLFTFNFTHPRRWCRCCTALHDAAFVSPSPAAPRQPHESARIVHTTCADCPEARRGCGADGGRALLAQAGVDATQASSAPPPRRTAPRRKELARAPPLARSASLFIRPASTSKYEDDAARVPGRCAARKTRVALALPAALASAPSRTRQSASPRAFPCSRGPLAGSRRLV